MGWIEQSIPNDDEGRPMYKGGIELRNDKNERLASIIWFYDGGPYYAHAMDVNDPALIRRIGAIETLDGAKYLCLEAIEGREDLSGRAAYRRL